VALRTLARLRWGKRGEKPQVEERDRRIEECKICASETHITKTSGEYIGFSTLANYKKGAKLKKEIRKKKKFLKR